MCRPSVAGWSLLMQGKEGVRDQNTIWEAPGKTQRERRPPVPSSACASACLPACLAVPAAWDVDLAQLPSRRGFCPLLPRQAAVGECVHCPGLQ
jgi:hypothetical protein